MHRTANQQPQSPIAMPNMHSSDNSVMPSSEPWDTTSADPFAPVTAPSAHYIDVVTKLFDHWRIWFGAKVSANTRFGTAWVIEWADYLESQSATLDEMRQAYRISKGLDFPPTNAHDFLALARKSRYPDAMAALQIAAAAVADAQYQSAVDWQHGVIYAAANRFGTWHLLADSADRLIKPWTQVYEQVCKEADAGADFQLPISQQIEYKHKSASREFVAGVFEKLSHMIKKGAIA